MQAKRLHPSFSENLLSIHFDNVKGGTAWRSTPFTVPITIQNPMNVRASAASNGFITQSASDIPCRWHAQLDTQAERFIARITKSNSGIATNNASTEVSRATAIAKPEVLPPLMAHIPQALRTGVRWVVWKLEGRGERAKSTKVPYCPTLLNTRAKSNDPASWGTFEQAEAAYEEGDFVGVGIMLNGDGLVGVDIDGCVKEGVIQPEAMTLMDSLGVEYVEYSPSGQGLRGFGYAENLESGVSGTYGDLKVELYSNVRFLTVTGHTVEDGPIVPLPGFSELAERIRGKKKVNTRTGELERVPAALQQGALVRRIQSGDVFHDCLRDLAASWISTGMIAGGAVNALYALMDTAPVPHDGRWAARRAEIPRLVSSAVLKYAPMGVNTSSIMAMPAPATAETSDQPNDAIQSDSAVQPRYELISADDLAGAPPLKWMVRGLLPQTGLTALYGPSGSGKSFLALDLAATVAGGANEWYGMRVKNCPVTYCVLEGEGGMGKRVKAWQQHHDKPLPGTLRFVTEAINLLRAEDLRDLIEAIRQAGGDGGLVVLDTLNRAAPEADENSSKDMGTIIAAAKALQASTGGLVMVVHHTGKAIAAGMRGHSSLFAAMDAVIGVAKMDSGPQWEVQKSKDDATGAQYPFCLETLVVGTDDEGDEVTSCVALPVAPPLGLRKSRTLGKHQQPALEVIEAMFESSQETPPFVLIDQAVAAVAQKLDAGPKHKRERAKEAIAGLAAKSKIKMNDSYIFPIAPPT
jgi:hypothetical protein